MKAETASEIVGILERLGAPHGNDLRTRTGELLRTVGVWEVAHRLRALTSERASQVTAFLNYLAEHYPAAADRIQILLTATKGEDKDLVKREFGGD